MKKWLLLPLFTLGTLVGTVFYLSTPPVISDRPDQLPFSESDQQFQETFLKPHYYEGVGRLKNYYAKVENLENPIDQPLVLVTGLEDITENWWETAKEALKFGFRHVYIVELRGQGKSQRVDDNKAVHINNFNNYLEDLVRAFRDIEKNYGSQNQSPFVICHSTGCLVYAAALNQIRAQIPRWEPEKVSFWAPLIKPKVSPLLNNPLVKPILGGVDKLGMTMGRRVLAKKFLPKPFEENVVTTDKQRYQWSEQVSLASEQKSSGVSLRWALETFPQAERLLQSQYDSITQPCLVFKAEDEQVVRNDWQINNEYFRVETAPESKHALHIEKQEVFLEVANRTFRFFMDR